MKKGRSPGYRERPFAFFTVKSQASAYDYGCLNDHCFSNCGSYYCANFRAGGRCNHDGAVTTLRGGKSDDSVGSMGALSVDLEWSDVWSGDSAVSKDDSE